MKYTQSGHIFNKNSHALVDYVLVYIKSLQGIFYCFAQLVEFVLGHGITFKTAQSRQFLRNFETKL